MSVRLPPPHIPGMAYVNRVFISLKPTMSGRKKKPRTKKKPLDTKGKTAKPKRNKTKGESKKGNKK